MQNGICEAFNGRMRDEILNETLFFSLGHARLIETDNRTVVKAYETKIAALESEKLVLAEKAATAGKPARPLAKMFELASLFLLNTCKILESENFDLRRTVLRLTFPERLAYVRGTGFRTPDLSLPSKMSGTNQMAIEDMAVCKGPTSNLLQQKSPFRHGPGPASEYVVVDLLKIVI